MGGRYLGCYSFVGFRVEDLGVYYTHPRNTESQWFRFRISDLGFRGKATGFGV